MINPMLALNQIKTTKPKMNAVDNDCPRFRPFASPTHRIKVKKANYTTSLDPRGHIPVYEYLINGQSVMWDRESGYVHFTGIWKSLGNSKADIVKMVDSNPELQVKKIRGGFLKIQGTWMPYELAYVLCKRTSWIIRKELVAMFGPRFINDVLDPSHPEYGCLLLDPKKALGMGNRRNGYATMRQATHPYRRDFMRKAKVTSPRLPKNSTTKKVTNKAVLHSMSLSRLLNSSSLAETREECSIDRRSNQVHQEAVLRKSFTESPNTTPSPTFRVVPSFPMLVDWTHKESENIENKQRLLPPILTDHPLMQSTSEPRITPIYSPSCSSSQSWSPVSPAAESMSSSPTTTVTNSVYDKDIIDTINATILLQRLSQDDGARPFKPMQSKSIPSKVMVGNQEFRICWDS